MQSAKPRPGITATTWWTLGMGIALCASLTGQGLLLLGFLLLSFVLLWIFAEREKRASALRLYGFLCASVLAIRLGFRIIFNQSDSMQVTALHLPRLSFVVLNQPIQLIGDVSWLSLNAGLIDGLRLAAIIMGFAMANTVANPRKLLRSTPSALYEVATAAAVAVNLAPQLVLSIRRISKARQLRGESAGFSRIGGLLIPLLEDTVQRSLDLAASMDVRGFGRRGSLSKGTHLFSRLSSSAGLVLLSASIYLLLASNSPLWLSLALMCVSAALFWVTVRIANMQSTRTKLVLESRGRLDYLVLALVFCGVALLAATHISQATGWPQLSWWAA